VHSSEEEKKGRWPNKAQKLPLNLTLYDQARKETN
jgi:hypothetical protein